MLSGYPIGDSFHLSIEGGREGMGRCVCVGGGGGSTVV